MTILTKEQRDDLAKKLDELIKLPTWAEPFDRIGLKLALNYLDENYADKVPEKLHDEIQAVVECFLADDYAGILEVIPSVINEIVDIPGLDEDTEGTFLAINLKATFEFIKYIAEKRK